MQNLQQAHIFTKGARKMKKRTRKEIKQEAIKFLSQGEYILTEFTRELRLTTNNALKLLADLDQDGVLEKSHKPSFKSNHLCMHYHISLSSEKP